MKLILLSGGSGKRLWPLSNNSRSKQFLKILNDQQGNYQSMVQRVWSQIVKAGLENSAYIATNKGQYDIIKSQLGDNLPIILEPESMDTFPAIALAATYIYSVDEADPDDVIVVMPVDPYVEIDFFSKIMQLELTINQSQADIALIGVKPTHPSEKFGYIIPEQDHYSNAPFMKVSQFLEKPSKEKAKLLIQQSALWNCGVFGFKLKYLISILNQRGLPTNYHEMQKYYLQMPKISFDFEIVEKSESVVTITHEGIWKDLGTWNALTEEMGTKIFGKGIMANDVESTHIVNELDIPIVVTGVNNLIIAASPDGILVADKESSTRLKEVIKGLDQRPMFEERRWGWFKVLDYTISNTGEEILTKRICITAGNNLSYQFHNKRNEVWTIVKGVGSIVLDKNIHKVKPGDVFQIPSGMNHSIKAITDLEVIEVQYGKELIDEDIIRIETTWDEIEKLLTT